MEGRLGVLGSLGREFVGGVVGRVAGVEGSETTLRGGFSGSFAEALLSSEGFSRVLAVPCGAVGSFGVDEVPWPADALGVEGEAFVSGERSVLRRGSCESAAFA